jgi:hypothetical protein
MRETRQQTSKSDIDELPPSTPEWVAMRVFVAAYLKTAHLKPRARAAAFVREASAMFDNEENLGLLFPIRPSSQSSDVSRSRRQAMAMYRQYLPTFIACIPEERE